MRKRSAAIEKVREDLKESAKTIDLALLIGPNKLTPADIEKVEQATLMLAEVGVAWWDRAEAEDASREGSPS